MTKQVLDDVERVLHPGPHLRQRALHRLGPIPQSFGQGFDDAPLDRDVPGDIAVLKFRPLVRPGIAGIGEDSLLPAMQQAKRTNWKRLRGPRRVDAPPVLVGMPPGPVVPRLTTWPIS